MLFLLRGILLKGKFVRLAMLSSLAVLAASGCQQEPPAGIGAQFPVLPVRTSAGEEQTFASPANKLLVLNVWAVWCPPCREEMPSLQRLSARLDADRFQVAGLVVEEDPYLVREFLQRHGVRFPVYLLAMQDAIQKLDVQNYPLTLLIDGNGRILARITGALDWNNPAVFQLLQQLEAGSAVAPEALKKVIRQARPSFL